MIHADRRQYHIMAAPGEVGGYCLLPGDPGRCEKIAAYLDNPYHLVQNREFNLWCGTLLGERVTVCSTGIGGPSAAIAAEELAACGAHTMIRVGANADKPIQINLRTSPIYDAALGDQNVGISGLTNKQTANGELQVVAINGTRTWLKVEFNGKDASGNDKSGTFYCRLTYIEEYKNSSGGAGGMG